MSGFRPLSAAAAALAVASGGAGVTLAAATPASAAPSCAGTALVTGVFQSKLVPIRVPTTANGVRNMHCDLGLGNAGSAVARLQIALNNKCNRVWWHSALLAVDGSYGSHTRTAVKTVQHNLGISSSGVYGPITGHLLSWPIAGANSLRCAAWHSSGAPPA
jgi:hypothetical protein